MMLANGLAQRWGRGDTTTIIAYYGKTRLRASGRAAARLEAGLGARPEVISQPAFFEKVAPVTVSELIHHKTNIQFIWIFQIDPYISEFRVI